MKRHPRADWSNINNDTLEIIQKKLPLPDIVECRAVCRSWRSITKTHITSTLISPSAGPPLLMFSFDSHNLSRCYFLDHVRRNTGEYFFLANLNSYELLSQLTDCVGYSHGWFLFLDKPKRRNRERSLCLFNPLCSPFSFPLISGELLSTVKGTRNICIQKAALFGDPIFGAFGVAVIHGVNGDIWFAKCGDRKFSQLGKKLQYRDWPDRHDPSKFVKDIICFNNCIYGFTCTEDHRHHRIEVWDCSIRTYHPPLNTLDFELQFEDGHKLNDPSKRSILRLVESDGQLLLVSFQLYKLLHMRRPMFHKWASEWTTTCRVYMMDFHQKEWVQINS